MNINELTIGQVKEITNLFGDKTESKKSHPYQIGQNYFIRTITFFYVGKLKAVYDDVLVLSEASWVADTGRFYDALKLGLEKQSNSEIEPFVNDVLISRGALVDATVYDFDLPKTQK